MFAKFILTAAILALTPAVLKPAEEYQLGPDSQRQAGVPQGKVTKYTWTTSKIFPGTVRDYWVYVPTQYRPGNPAPFMVFQDGGGFVSEDGQWRAPIVFDNLIHKRQMPPTIGIFINPGVMPAISPDRQAQFNRSFEYDALGDRYARFLIDEILLEVAKEYTVSTNPNAGAIAGSSSGGIAAFTAAWTRPDTFRRVLSFIGSYTNLRGGHVYSSLIRKTEARPLRVYLQDGRNDQNIYSGNWFIGNQDMASALAYAGYDSTFVIGDEGHNSKHGSAILPDALRWLWRDYPKPIAMPVSAGERRYVDEILEPGKDWELVSQGYKFTEGPAIDRHGNLFFTDLQSSRIHKLSADGTVSLFKEDTGRANGLMFGPDGRLYACQNGRKRIVAYAMDGTESVIAEGMGSNDLAINSHGEIYFSEPGAKRVWFIDRTGAKRVVAQEGIASPNGVRLSPDHAMLSVADYVNKWVWSYQVQPDGSLAHGQAFHRLETEDDAAVNPDGMTYDSEGLLYVATRIGLQVCDQAGRVIGIINKPQPGPLANAVFGGTDLRTLYVMAGDKVYRRQLRKKGVFPWTPVKLPAPRM